METATRPVGELLRDWRQRRRLSQLGLALESEISARHLSFVETGRATPSREMLLHLAEQLQVPLRERNALLLAAGYAPAYRERSFDDPALADARRAVELVLAGHEPYPALVVDRHWTLVASNRSVGFLMAGIAPEMLQPPLNVLRLSLHPKGLAPRIVNFSEWRTHIIARLRRQVEVTADATLAELLRELRGYPAPSDASASTHEPGTVVAVPMRLHTEAGTLALISTTTVFGTPTDITLSELALETFFPADPAAADLLRRLSGA